MFSDNLRQAIPVCTISRVRFLSFRFLSPEKNIAGFYILIRLLLFESGQYIYILEKRQHDRSTGNRVSRENSREKKPSTLKKYILDERTTEVHCCSSPSARIRHEVERERVKKVQRMKKKTHTPEKIDGKMDLSRL